jgi:hypothetical protein
VCVSLNLKEIKFFLINLKTIKVYTTKLATDF